MARALIRVACGLRWRQVHDMARQPFKAAQGCWVVQIGYQRHGAGSPQLRTALRLAGDGNDAKRVPYQWQQAHTDIAAADDQQARAGKFINVDVFHK
ncbi:hypothetical protein GCM10027277_45690 [Pseudoduganella ginsengisoli]